MIVRFIALLAAVAALLGLLTWTAKAIDKRGYDRAAAVYGEAIEKTQRQAAQSLAIETAKTRAAEQALQAAVDAQNRKDANHVQTLATLRRQLDAYIGPGMRLRDPRAAGCGGGGDCPQGEVARAAGAGAADPGPAGGLLSVPLTELLGRIVREADELNAAYGSCRAWAELVLTLPP